MEYPNISESGTNARTILAAARSSIPSMRPRREFRSPMISPIYSSGIVTSTFMIGSSRTGAPCFMASLNAREPAIWNAISGRVDLVVGSVVAVCVNAYYRESAEDTGLHRILDTFVYSRDVFLRNRTADNRRLEGVCLLTVCIHRLEFNFTVSVLSASTGLFAYLLSMSVALVMVSL